MKGKFYITLFFITVLFSQKNYGQYITIDENYTAQQLVQNVLVNNPCATSSNFSISGGNFPTGEKSYAFFDATGSSFPFQNGIVLSTGRASNTQGPNNSLSDDGQNMGWLGDPDLEQALGLGNSFNATVLEFDFIPFGDKFSFDYIFSSEQYLSNPSPNQCNFTDGFAFLLKEDGTNNYINLALIPNTSIPVKVNTVRGTGTICPPANQVYFDAFNGTEHPTNFNGQTKVMTAQADVMPGTGYHIKIVIADEGNARFDSAIFLDGGSFDFGVNLGDDRLIATGNPLCENETLQLNAITTNAFTYQWYKDNQIITGEIGSSYTVTTAGNYKIEIVINGNCLYTSDINIEYAPTLIQNQTLFEECDTDGTNDGKTFFDLNFIKTQLFSNLPTSFQIAFFDSTTSITPLAENYINTTANQQTIYARVTNVQCYTDFPIQLKVNNFSLGQNEIIGLCNGSSKTLSVPNGYTTYSWNTNPIQTTNQINVNTAGIYTVTVTNTNGCIATKTFTVEASEPAIITNITVSDFSENNSASIQVIGQGNYEYSLNGINYQDSNTFNSLSLGNYTFFIRDRNGCGITTGTFQVLAAPKFFTPNGDGFNEIWQVPLLQLQPKTIITIFDRYGKLIYNFRANQQGWNGQYNGLPLPATDYWYTIEFENGRLIKGHFSLIR